MNFNDLVQAIKNIPNPNIKVNAKAPEFTEMTFYILGKEYTLKRGQKLRMLAPEDTVLKAGDEIFSISID